MSVKKDDYIGFTFNGVHSSELGIKRVSDGSRFNENLLPTSQDKTVQVPGRDGTYLFGSYFTQKPFTISYAFDSLSEEQLSRIKEVFGDKKVHELVFDETPYKAYRAKVTGTAQIKYIPFEEGEGRERIYKGEGSLQFTAYEPYAICKHKYLSEYQSEYDNINEWKDAAGLLSEQGNYDKLGGDGANSIKLYNPGVKETDFVLTLDFIGGVVPQSTISIDADHQLQLKEIAAMGIEDSKDDQIKISSKLNLIEGYKNGKKTGNVYNKYIKAGFFFKIPLIKDKDVSMELGDAAQNFKSIEYNYLYL